LRKKGFLIDLFIGRSKKNQILKNQGEKGNKKKEKKPHLAVL
jgi:hypothetical protein